MRIQIIRNIGWTYESPNGRDTEYLNYDSINWADIPYNIVDIGDKYDIVINSRYLGNNIFELDSLPTSDKIYIYYMKEVVIKAGTRCNKVTAYMYSDNTKYTYYTDDVNSVFENLYATGKCKQAEDYDTYIHCTPECPSTDYCVDLYTKAEYPDEDIIGSHFEVCVKEYQYICI
jgi:hypothetical protein